MAEEKEKEKKDDAVEAAAAKVAQESVPTPEPPAKTVTCPKCGCAWPEGERPVRPDWLKLEPNGVEAKILCPDVANAAHVGLVRGAVMRAIGQMNRKTDGMNRRVRIFTEQINEAEGEALDSLLAEREKLGEETISIQHEVLALLLGDALLADANGDPAWPFKAKENIPNPKGGEPLVKAGALLPHPKTFSHDHGVQVRIIMEIPELYLERLENGIMDVCNYPVFTAGR